MRLGSTPSLATVMGSTVLAEHLSMPSQFLLSRGPTSPAVNGYVHAMVKDGYKLLTLAPQCNAFL